MHAGYAASVSQAKLGMMHRAAVQLQTDPEMYGSVQIKPVIMCAAVNLKLPITCHVVDIYAGWIPPG